MQNRLIYCLLPAIIALTSGWALGQRSISNVNATSAGLNVAWSNQLGISATGELQDWQLVVDENKSEVFFVVTAGKRTETYGQSGLNPFGKPYGIEGAKLKAEDRKRLIDIENKYYERDIEVSISNYTVPKTTLIVMSDNGNLASVDGNTGVVNWTRLIGDSRLPGIGVGSSKGNVIVAKGTQIFCVDFETGREKWRRRCDHPISSSPVCSDDDVYVPLTNGQLQTFSLDGSDALTYSYAGSGESFGRPVLTEKNVIWTTITGAINVAPKARKTVRYRVNTVGEVVSSPTAGLGMIFAGTREGFLYGVTEKGGQIEWDFPTGSSISQPAVVYGKDVYVVTDSEQLFKLEAQSGYAPGLWGQPLAGITKIVGFGKNSIYCIDKNGSLVGVDRENKSITSRISGSRVGMVLTNNLTDRMFVASRSGFIQCLHEISSAQPAFLDSELASKVGSANKNGSGNKEGSGSKDGSGSKEENPFAGDSSEGSDTKEENPFGDDGNAGADADAEGSDTKEDDNPFGGGGDADAGDSDNPFGGDSEEDPFGAENDDEEENPFGNG